MIKPLFLKEINSATAGAPALDLMEKYFETYSNTRILGSLKDDFYYLLYLQPDSTTPALKVPKEVFFKLNKNADLVEISNGISYTNLTNRDSVLNKNNYPFCTISSKSAGNIVFENDNIYILKWSSNINPIGLSMNEYFKKENVYFSGNEPILSVFFFFII